MIDATFPLVWRRRLLGLTCGLIALLLAGTSSGPCGEPVTGDLAQRFLDEAPRRWKDYHSWAEGLDGTVTVLKTMGDKQVLHVQAEFKHNSRCRMCIDRDLLPDSAKKREGKVLAFNPAYAFTLQRQTASSSWAVTEVEKRAEGATSATVRLYELDSEPLVRIPIYLFTVELPDVVQMPTFRVLRATAASRDGMDLVQVEFDNTHPMKEPGSKFCPIQAGSMLLDPNRFWYLRSCDLRCKFGDGDSTVKVENELADPSTKYPLLKHQVTNLDTNHPQLGRVTQQWVRDFDLHETSRLPPDDDFTLTAFGLPEPFDVPKKSVWTRWYIWTGVAGVLCLLAGLAVRRIRRRQAA